MSAQLDRLKSRLEAIPKSVRVGVQPALQRSAEELTTRMKQLAPEDTGDLIESITVTPAGEKTPAYSQGSEGRRRTKGKKKARRSAMSGGGVTVPENAVAVTVGNSEVRYTHLVEYGTADTPAQPFFWPAFRLLRKRITNRMKRAISKAVKEAR